MSVHSSASVTGSDLDDVDIPSALPQTAAADTVMKATESFTQASATTSEDTQIKPLTEEEKDALVSLQLQETETLTLLFLPSLRVQADTEEATAVSQRNEAYAELVQSHSSAADSFVRHHTQTVTFSLKNKDVQAVPAPTRDAGCVATSWDIDGARLGLQVVASHNCHRLPTSR